MPGDMVVIPDKQIKELPRPVEKRHIFVRKGFRALYRLQVFDYEEPRACQDYTLVIDDKLTFQGTTDKSGTLEHYIPANSRKGQLTIGEEEAQLSIRFGYLDPIEENTGVQKRLINLGFYAGEAHGKLDDATENAIKIFQLRFGLEPTGQADDDTIGKLKGMHDIISEFPPVPNQTDSSPDSGASDAGA